MAFQRFEPGHSLNGVTIAGTTLDSRSGSVVPGAGTYAVGLCFRNPGGTDILVADSGAQGWFIVSEG